MSECHELGHKYALSVRSDGRLYWGCLNGCGDVFPLDLDQPDSFAGEVLPTKEAIEDIKNLILENERLKMDLRTAKKEENHYEMSLHHISAFIEKLKREDDPKKSNSLLLFHQRLNSFCKEILLEVDKSHVVELKTPDLNKPGLKAFPGAINAIEKHRCPTCGEQINASDFKDELSIKEFGISGMCQKCQDGVFRG